jgi:membrane-associated phospholipid phosphatase
MRAVKKECAKILLLVLGAIAAFASARLPPRVISGGEGIGKTHCPSEAIPFKLLMVFVFTTVPTAIYKMRRRDSSEGAYKDTYFFAWASAGVMLLCNISKALVGSLRPDFLDRMKRFPVGSRVVEEGRRSFPSGHTALAVLATVHIAYCSLQAMKRGHFLTPSLLTVCFSLGSIGVGISRVLDHRHHPGDVLAGAILGLVVSTLIIAAAEDAGEEGREKLPQSSPRSRLK